MSLISKSSEQGDFKLAEEGNWPAVCDAVIDMGYQTSEYKGESKTQLKLYLRFQLPDQRTDDDRPMVIGGLYTNSMFEKAKIRLQIIDPLGFKLDDAGNFDLSQLIGQPCMLQVKHNDKGEKTYANISSVAQMPKSTKPKDMPKLEGEPILFDLDNQQDLDRLPVWIQKKIGTPITEETPKRGKDGFENAEIPFAWVAGLLLAGMLAVAPVASEAFTPDPVPEPCPRCDIDDERKGPTNPW